MIILIQQKPKKKTIVDIPVEELNAMVPDGRVLVQEFEPDHRWLTTPRTITREYMR